MASPAANANGHRRAQLRLTVLAEETDCAICGQPVDKTLTMDWQRHGARCKGDGCPGCVPHPMRAEVDEIVPRSKGGDPLERGNCQLAHRICNARKGNGTSRSTRPALVDPFPTLSQWPGWQGPRTPTAAGPPLA